MAKSNLQALRWQGFSGRRGWTLGIAIAMLPCIALAAVFVPNFGFSILYAIPLTLLGCSGQARAMRWMTPVVIALAFITYFLKFWLEPPAVGPQFLNFRIVNRVMVAGMLWLLSKVLGMWLEVDDYRQDPLWSEAFDRAQGQIRTMLGMLIAMPTATSILRFCTWFRWLPARGCAACGCCGHCVCCWWCWPSAGCIGDRLLARKKHFSATCKTAFLTAG
jgi:hypothetical protein